MTTLRLPLPLFLALAYVAFGTPLPAQTNDAPPPPRENTTPGKSAARSAPRTQNPPRLVKPDSYWRKNLPWISYQVTRHKATENPYSGFFWNHHEDGVYTCICCGSFLFDSTTKFESGTGWPSFWKPFATTRIKTKPDASLGVIRTEVLCRTCDAHLGHVFPDGPPPTGMRFCINSASLDFLDRAAARARLEAEQSAAESKTQTEPTANPSAPPDKPNAQDPPAQPTSSPPRSPSRGRNSPPA